MDSSIEEGFAMVQKLTEQEKSRVEEPETENQESEN